MKKTKKHIRVKLIANPGAGDASQSALRLEQVTHYLADTGLKVDVALAKPKREATSIARKAVKDGYDVVIAMGGDGTIAAVILGLAGTKVRLGIIPAGTFNDIATSLGIPEDLKKACDLIASGHDRKLDLGQISTRKKKKFYFFNIAAVGLLATIFPAVKEIPKRKFSGLKNAISTFLNFDSKPTVFLTLNNESKIKVETMLVTIVNTPLAGAKNLVAPDALMDDGLLDVAVYPGFNNAGLVSYFAQTANQGTIPDGTIQRYRVRKMKIKSSPKLDVAAEGDIMLGNGTARIKVLPGALWVLAPKPGLGAEKPHVENGAHLPEPVAEV
jgi:YegS/Rv2252/BmrU family lipid kinase